MSDVQPSPPVASPPANAVTMASAFLVGLIAYWLPRLPHLGGCGGSRYTIIGQAGVLALLGLTAGFAQGRRLFLGAGGTGFGCAWIADVLLSGALPATFRCSHQLLPFEALFFAVLIGLPTGLGSAAGTMFVRAGHAGATAARRRQLAQLFIALAGLLALMTPALLPLQLQANERRALSTIAELAQLQFAFQARHPDLGYACRLADLSSAFARASPAGAGTAREDAWVGGYHYRLSCAQATPPHIDFVIEATPFCVPDCGNVAYCVSRSGKIRSLPRSSRAHWAKDCRGKGAVVTSVAQ